MSTTGDSIQLLTHSRTQCAKACLRRHFFQYELGLRPVESSKPLRMGTAVHEGLDRLAKGESIGAVMGWVQSAYATVPEGFDPVEWAVEGQTVMRLLSGYAWRWGGESDTFDVIATEQQFTLPIVNPATNRSTPTFLNAGKIDKIVRLRDGRLAVMEHKTTSGDINPNADYWRRLRMDQQVTRYLLAARDLGHDVACVVYDVIRKPQISPRKIPKADLAVIKATGLYHDEACDPAALDGLDRETPAMFGARLTSDIVSRPEFYFQRQEIARLDADVEEFRQELWDDQKHLRECQLSNRWPRNTAACLAPFRCSFFDLCSQNWKPEVIPVTEPPTGFIVGELHPELASVAQEV